MSQSTLETNPDETTEATGASGSELESEICDLGTFEGFNFRHDGAIEESLTAEQVVGWDHDTRGEAEFWPSGDHPGVSWVFRGQTSVTGRELRALSRLLNSIGDDSDETFIKIRYALDYQGVDLDDLTQDAIEDRFVHIFTGSNFCDVREEAAYELFELFYPDEYAMWEKSECDGLIFDTDRFLDSPVWHTEEIKFGDKAVLLVCSM